MKKLYNIKKKIKIKKKKKKKKKKKITLNVILNPKSLILHVQ